MAAFAVADRAASARALRHGEMSLRTAAEMDAIERAGAAVALALDAASAAVRAGATTAEQVLNLLALAGEMVGVGEYRVERGGNYGRFKIA